MSGENGTVEESNVDGLDETDALAGPDIVILEDEEAPLLPVVQFHS